MKINFFNLGERRQQWNEVKSELYKVWVGNTYPVLPAWLDFDFQAAFKHTQKTHSLSECQKALKL